MSGGSLPFLGDEALEQQIDLGRIDRGDAEHVADRGIGRRAAPLTQDASGCAHSGRCRGRSESNAHSSSSSISASSLRKRGFAASRSTPSGKCRVSAFPGQILKMLLRGLARRHRLVRILVLQLIERRSVMRSAKRTVSRDRFGIIAKQPHHLRRRLQMPLGIGFQPRPASSMVRLLADAGDHVLQDAALGRRDRARHWWRSAARAPSAAMRCKLGQPALVVAAMKQAGAEPDAVRRQARQRVERAQRRRSSMRYAGISTSSSPSLNSSEIVELQHGIRPCRRAACRC